MKSRTRYLLFIIIAAVLLSSPLCLWKTDSALALSGVSVMAELPQMTVKSLLSGEYQSALSEYVEQNLPGRPFLVRLRNQITFSVFRTPANNNYSIGRGKNLFSVGNVSAYLQYREPVTEEYAVELVGKLKRLEKLLSDTGRQMYIYITPYKSRYYADDLPWVARAMAPEQKENNYEQLMKQLAGSGLEYFDSVEYLEDHKFDSRVPLFYDTNYHWSVYVGNCVGAVFGDYLEEKSGFNLPEITVDAEPCEEPVSPDADAVTVFNLLEKPYGEYFRPVVTVTDPETDAPGVLFQGGSFMGQSLSMLLQNQYFGKDVYIENTQMFAGQFSQVQQFSEYEELGLGELMKDIDIVVLEVNEPSIPSMSFGFIDYLLENPQVLGTEP